MKHELSPEGQQLLTRYADRGWFDAAGDDRLRDAFSPAQLLRPAYLVLASGMPILPSSEVQITARCNYWPFRGRRLVVAPHTARCFELLDLKVMHRSQFRRGAALQLHDCVEEAEPELIRWPLEICGASVEIIIRAIILAHAAIENDLGTSFEMLLIGEVA